MNPGRKNPCIYFLCCRNEVDNIGNRLNPNSLKVQSRQGAKVSRVPVFGLAQLSMGMAGEEEIRGQMQSNTKHMDWVAYC